LRGGWERLYEEAPLCSTITKLISKPGLAFSPVGEDGMGGMLSLKGDKTEEGLGGERRRGGVRNACAEETEVG